MAYLEFGQHQFAQPHPLQAFELAKRPVERPVEARFVAEQAIQCRRLGNNTAYVFDHQTLRLDCGSHLLMFIESSSAASPS